jgi:hypothetical protein
MGFGKIGIGKMGINPNLLIHEWNHPFHAGV